MATQRRQRGGAWGGQGSAVVCARVGAGGYCAWFWALYMVWAWHRLDLHGDTCGLSWGNFVKEKRFLSIFCIFSIFDKLTYCAFCTGYQLIGISCSGMHNMFKEEHKLRCA